MTLIRSDGIVVGESSLPPEQLPEMENHADRPEILESQTQEYGISSRFSNTLKQQLIYVARQVDEHRYGFRYVRVAQSLESVTILARSHQRLHYLTLGFMLVIIAIVGFLFKGWVTDPLSELARVAKDIGEGNLDRRATVKSSGEIAELAQVMNQMADTVQKDLERIRRMEQVRSEFLGNVTHELKTPISSISGYLETLLDGALDDPQVNRTFLKKSLSNSKRLEALVTDLVDISRIESGELSMNFQSFNLMPIIRNVQEDAHQRVADKKIRIEVDSTNENKVNVFGDPDRLRQVFDNLVSNAIRYTDEGYIKITVRENEDFVHVAVEDTGVGIPVKSLPRIFERFYRTDKARDRSKGGTGLGLSITKHIIEAHHSRINVRSEEGQGTVFSFDLPVKRN